MQDNKFNEVVEQYGNRLYTLAYRMVGNREEAKDIVQDTFYLAYKNIEQFRRQSNVYTWIYRICVNECLRQRKKERNKNECSFDDSKLGLISRENRNWIEDPENAAAVKELTDFIRRECHQIVMQGLTDEQRIVFILRVIMDLSYSEISMVLAIDESVIKARLNRARNRLLKHFENDCEWFKNGAEGRCCRNKLGYALSLDVDILKRVDEDIDLYARTKKEAATNQMMIDDIYKSLPALKLDFRKEIKEYI